MTSHVHKIRYAVAALMLALAACSGSDKTSDAASTGSTTPAESRVGATTSEAAHSSCPPASAPTAALPSALPRNLPMPPSVRIGQVQSTSDRVSVSFDAAVALETAVHAVNNALPGAGFTVGNAEMEKRDAELDFSGGGVRGRYQFVRVADCSVRGTVTIQPTS